MGSRIPTACRGLYPCCPTVTPAAFVNNHTAERGDTVRDAGSPGCAAVEGVSLHACPCSVMVRCLGPCRILLNRPSDTLSYKLDEGGNVVSDTGAVECGQILASVSRANDGPRVAARCQHSVHQEPRHASVPVCVRMDIPEKPMPKDGPHAGLLLAPQEIEELCHGIADRLPPGRYVPRRAQIDRVSAITCERRRSDQASLHARTEQFPVPFAMTSTYEIRCLCSSDDPGNVALDKLKRLPVASRG